MNTDPRLQTYEQRLGAEARRQANEDVVLILLCGLSVIAALVSFFVIW